MIFVLKLLVVVDDAVMGQGKGHAAGLAGERMVVKVPFFVPLGGHAGVSHDEMGILTETEPHPMSHPGSFLDVQTLTGEVGNPGGISAPGLAGDGQCAEDLLSLIQ